MLILYDAAERKWLHFQDAIDAITTCRVDEVLPALRQVEQLVHQRKLYAAGFLSYEAVPAFDPALQAHPPGDFPLLWFGLYPAPQAFQTPQASPASYSLGEWTPSIAWPDYEADIARIKEHIARGETYQVNYTFRLHAGFTGDACSLFLDLAQAQHTDYAAFVDTGRFAICSASPELFFRLDGNHITTRPMKGTASRGRTQTEDKTQAEWLHNSSKNRAENVMIVDMVRNDLGRIAETGSVRVPALFEIERYPTLWQMTSTVTAASGASITDILASIFPCASITGAPKVRTTGIIASLESEPRRIYTGCLGWIAPGRQAQFNVAIRTVLVDRERGQAEYGVGGGIVWDSSAQEEYAECQTKARLLTHKPPAFDLLEAILWSPEEGYFLLAYHLQRLSDSASYFGFPVEIAKVQACLDKSTASLPAEAHKLNLLVARDGSLTCRAAPMTAVRKPDPARLRLAVKPVDSDNILLYHKTSNRQVYDEARLGCKNCDEALLWNERGELTEVGTANIVLEMDGQRLTPPLTSGLLPGTFRLWLLEQGQIREQVLKMED